MAQHLTWIDNTKAICMICVYILHAEVYSGFEDVSYGLLFKPFYVNAFFFVSGYLFFRKWINTNIIHNIGGGYLSALESLMCRLMIPSLIFSAIVFIPKAFFHGADLNVMSFITNIFGGISYWFTSALFVAQAVLLTLVTILRRKDIWSYLLCSLLLFAIGWYLNYTRTENTAEAFLPWFWKTGIEYTLVMTLGGVYMKYENDINAMWKTILILSAGVYIVAMAMSFNGTNIPVMGLGGRCNLPGGILIASGIALIIALCRTIKGNSFLSFIGQNSIVFYFFSGVFPAFIGMVAQHIFIGRYYIVTLTVAAVSIALAWIATVIINKYLPFLIDIRKIKRG